MGRSEMMSKSVTGRQGARMIEVWPEDKADPYGHQRSLRIELPGTPKVLREDVVIRIGSGVAGPLKLADGYLPLLAMLAMAEECDLHLHGTVSRQMLANMVEYQRAWLMWEPRVFTRLAEITADEVIEPTVIRPTRAVQAFSGGLDAMFTTWFHRVGGEPIARLPLDRAVFVHGFDILRADREAFEIAFAKGRRALDPVGVELTRVKTNIRSALGGIGWETLHGVAIAAVLGQFADDYTHGLIGSSDAYELLHLPWGSNPVTDHLMSGAGMQIVHIGTGFNRVAKVKAIAGWPVAADNLRVCWRSKDKSKNCGVCEKCIATALAFKAQGLAIPASLKRDLSDEDILACKAGNEIQRERLRNLRLLAISNGVTGSWVEAIDKRFPHQQSA